MNSTVHSATFILAVTAALGIAKASGPVEVYALIDKVTIEPDSAKPERIIISGVFITAEYRTDVYSKPQKGFLYFSLPAQNSELVLREWADLKSVAGTRQVVGFGSSWYGKARVKKPDEPAKDPDEYILGNGVVRVNAEQSRAKALLNYKEH